MAGNSPDSNEHRSHDQRHRGPPIQLTDEEKAVLVECRRNSIARGLPLGVLSVLGLRYFVRQGRVPASVQKWSLFYYSGAFIVTFMMGVSSYRQKCMEKIMALENSRLADQVREHMARAGIQVSSDFKTRDKVSDSAPYQQPRARKYSRLDVILDDDNKSSADKPDDKIVFSSKEIDQEPLADQPVAFGDTTSKSWELSPSPQKGRTFDEIREENRLHQLQKNFPQKHIVENEHKEPQQKPAGSGRPVRRNKYGDIIYED